MMVEIEDLLGRIFARLRPNLEQIGFRLFRIESRIEAGILTPGSFLLGQLLQTMTPYGLQPNLFYRALARRKGIRAFLTETRQACPMRLHKDIIVGFAMRRVSSPGHVRSHARAYCSTLPPWACK